MTTSSVLAAAACPLWCTGDHQLRVNQSPDDPGDPVHESPTTDVATDRGGPAEQTVLHVGVEAYPEGGEFKQHIVVIGDQGEALYFSEDRARYFTLALQSAVANLETSGAQDDRTREARTDHRWEVDMLPESDAPLTLWMDGRYVAHLALPAAEALADLLRTRVEVLNS